MGRATTMYKITLADGSVIDGLTLNGNNFITKDEIKEQLFENNCSPVAISDGTNEEIHENMELVQITKVNNEYWFILRDIPKEELATIKIKSDIAYIAMMSGVEL